VARLSIDVTVANYIDSSQGLNGINSANLAPASIHCAGPFGDGTYDLDHGLRGESAVALQLGRPALLTLRFGPGSNARLELDRVVAGQLLMTALKMI